MLAYGCCLWFVDLGLVDGLVGWFVLFLFVFASVWLVGLLDLLLRWVVCCVLACIGLLCDLLGWLVVCGRGWVCLLV